ncbi:mandelate racemase [Candidatus Poribacteria bacterium]|jgi:D-galactarolactone cycloisomerase|nr:mandelate racemase [Candidatus Poribacteria bacterium]MBT5531606.1 mandelate racemase [Candidatus Poribacteria bacterium]MBT5714413.1 mandelate racemase [Candidatus Poribacteria bacterium]MBT7097042.1 mandelate racemase [Candidatus Poribacteria bacterium]MBT7803991.1 mandelate racemase [Candidatus Poribacteria bacterium]
MALPADIRISRVEAATLTGTRPRVVGRNSRRGVHGGYARDRVVRLTTNEGAAGWGWSLAEEDDARRLIGARLCDVFDPSTGTPDEHIKFDLALWDLAGVLLGEAVHGMLGDGGSHPVPLYDGSIYIDELDPDTGRDDGVEPMLDAVRTGLAAGFNAFKVKIGRGYQWMPKDAGMRRDIDVIRAIRDLIGDDMRLLIDGNNGYTPDEAREVMRHVGDCDIYWFEEPFPESVDECIAFRDFLREAGWDTLLADGESSRPDDFDDIVRAGGLDVIQFDLRFYSLTRWLAYMPLIREAGVIAAPHNWGSHLSGFYIPQFALGCADVSLAEIDSATMPAASTEGYVFADGALSVPDTPGFGIGLDDALFAEARDETGWSIESA